MALKLIAPSMAYAQQILDYKAEFIAAVDSMDGTSNLRNIDTVAQWLDRLAQNASEATVPPQLVPETLFLTVRTEDDCLVGMIDIRHRLNEYLMQFGGHIGYSVRPTERRKGYAKEQLRLALPYCKQIGIEKALITCYKDNIGSAKTIQANGGVLENELPEEGRITQRYWITLM